jgi:hypothetical protein
MAEQTPWRTISVRDFDSQWLSFLGVPFRPMGQRFWLVFGAAPEKTGIGPWPGLPGLF